MIRIGPYKLPNRLALAPMAGVTDLPFRQLCRELGAGYVVGEMLSSNPGLRNTRKSMLRANHEGEPEPRAIQIAGCDPQWMAEAAQFNVGQGAQIVDINMGCPAKKVLNRKAGSALLEDEGLVREILQAVVQAVEVPVTLKIRTGPDPDRRNGPIIAEIAAQSGVAAMAVHGRTRADRFMGQAEYDTIRAICQVVDIPVFANGDVLSPAEAKYVLEETGAQGLMIGRGAQGNPWIFREVQAYLDNGVELPPPGNEEVHRVLCEHLRALHEFYGPHQGVRIARKHIGWYLKGRSGGAELRARLMKVEEPDQQLGLIDAHFQRQERDAA